jgi:hypothetical protein
MTEAVFNFRNPTQQPRHIEPEPWELIDTDGFAYPAKGLCDSLRPPRTVDCHISWQISPGTQVNFILVFAELESNHDISAIMFGAKGSYHRFEINPMKPEALELFKIRTRSLPEVA